MSTCSVKLFGWRYEDVLAWVRFFSFFLGVGVGGGELRMSEDDGDGAWEMGREFMG